MQIDQVSGSEFRVVFTVNWKKALKTLVVLALAIGAYFVPWELNHDQRMCLTVFVGAAGLWVTELIPPFATAIIVIVLDVYLIGLPGHDVQTYLNPIANPILVLFFGGFILALAATKHGFDIRLARAFVKPFGTRPSMVLLGVILTTALFSMFMSNTATTAMMIAILAPVFKQFEDRERFKKALVLAVPFAANVGGMGTIIGTPPNAVAASVLQKAGTPVTFLGWMLIAVPIVIVLLLVLWTLLLLIFPPRKQRFDILFPEPLRVTPALAIVVVTFTLTIVMWLTSRLHGIPPAVTALLPVMIFTAFGVIGREDLRKIDWDILILVAGGLTLGVAMMNTGLSDWMMSRIPFGRVPLTLLLAVVMVISLLISNFMSNTAAANLMIPIVTAISVMSPMVGAVGVALACSLAMSLPISTPPNAIAFATRAVETRDMARYGTIVSVCGLILVLIALQIYERFTGLLAMPLAAPQ
jgi:sodium-dependent dicarboxylate transporter 2/3/5